MSDETSVLRHIWLSLSNVSTLFRLNTGIGWVGKGQSTRLQDGSVILKYARPIALGFSYPNTKPTKGAADLIGWSTVTITDEMVGKKIAVFTSVEVKNSKGGEKGEEQLRWYENIRNSGGIAIFAKSQEQAQELIKQSIESFHV